MNVAAWPFAALWWPLDLLLGTVGAWNAFTLLSYAGAGGLAALWLRSLGLGLGAALVGGLAFALAPYRVAQSTGHLLGPISMLLPLALWGVEKRRGVITAIALASIPLSGQVHLALGAIPFVLLYAWCRGRARAALPAVAVAVGAGLAVYAVAIEGSTGAAGRSFTQVERYSARSGDFLSSRIGDEFERFVFLGRVTPLVALAGLALLVWSGRRWLALALGAGAVVPMLAALGATLPVYEPVWRHLPGLRHTRVPERLMPIACLALAGLVAVLVDRLRWRLVPWAAVLVLAVDLRVSVYDALPDGGGGRAFAALRAAPPGRVLELPVLLPDDYAASVGLLDTIHAPRERPGGYSTTAPRSAQAVLRRLRAAGCRGSAAQLRRELRRLGVRYLLTRRSLERRAPCTARLRRLLARTGSRPLARGGDVTIHVLARTRP